MRKLILSTLIIASTSIHAIAGFDEAWIAFQKGNYNEALNECLQPTEVGDGNCMSLVGQLHELGEAGLAKDLAKAAEWQRAGAQQNSRRAQFYYGLALLNGEGVPKDTKQGADLIAKSSSQGYLQAHVLLATLYHAGEGVERDDTKALKLAKTAADEGFAAGHNLLGYILQHGKGVAKDVMQASVHYRIAAEQGDEYALNNLGLMYARGIGVPMDRVVACVLFDLSSARGLEGAQANRAKADAVLTKSQIEEATALSTHWKVGTPLPRKSKTWVEPKEPQMRMPTPVPRGGWLGTSGSVAWDFDHVGLIEAEPAAAGAAPKLATIEAGAQDFEAPGEYGVSTFFTDAADLDLVSRALPAQGFTVLSAKLGYKPKNPVDPASLSTEQLEAVEAFLAAIDANDDVQNMFVGLGS